MTTERDEIRRRNPVIASISWVIFIAIHATCALAFFVPFTWKLLVLALAGYVVRMWAITAGYHRYFAHRAYKTSRPFQLVLAWIGAAAVQKGPLWWSSTHRVHHKYSDMPEDVHSPKQRGFLYSHVGWFLGPAHEATNHGLIRDFAKYPELRFIDVFYWVPPVTYALLCCAIAGVPGLIWGFSISTVLLWHGTFVINSLAHVWGSRRYETTDTSRNNAVLALITLGEGWHNNHHHYQSSARQGFFWWELDASYYVLKALSWLGLVWDLRPVPEHVLDPAKSAARAAAGRAKAQAHQGALATAEQLLAELRVLSEQCWAELGAKKDALLAEFTAKKDALLAELSARRGAAAAEWNARRESIAAELERLSASLALESHARGA
jgi:stearoyl-CoA desaturase (delta-9 desaturase)